MYNTQLFIDRDGNIAGKHQKIMPTVGERLVHTGGWGDTLHAVYLGRARVSGLICGENSNPLAIFSLAAENAQIHAASQPNHFSKKEHSMAEADLSLCVESKLDHDYAGHYNRPDIFTLRVSRDVPSYLEETEGVRPRSLMPHRARARSGPGRGERGHVMGQRVLDAPGSVGIA